MLPVRALVVGFLFLAACAPIRSPQEERRDAKEQEAARRALVRHENRQREAEETASIRANQEKTLAAGREARAQAASAKRDDERAECDASRSERETQLQASLARWQHKADLIGWEAQHCKNVDASVAVRRVVQDARGEYHTVEGRDRGVDRVCNAPKPTEIEHVSADALSAPAPAASLTNRACRSSDVEASELFKTFWTEGSPWEGREARRQREHREANK